MSVKRVEFQSKLRLNSVIALLICLTLGSALASRAAASDRVISLAGEWKFVRGGPDCPNAPGPLPEITYSDTIQLPGTTDTNKKGPPNNSGSTYSLSQPYNFNGVCWYEREIIIPAAWQGKRITFSMERTKYTQCWLDGKPLGECKIFCTPQDYELGVSLTPGVHRLTVAVDNRRNPPVGADAHQFSGGTQGNWNGIIGKIELLATPEVWMDDVQLYPSAADHKVLVKIRLRNETTTAGQGTLKFVVQGKGISTAASKTVPVKWAVGDTAVETTLSLGTDAALWDEFHPELHQLTVSLSGTGIDDQQQVSFGLRTFAADGQQFTLNGRPVFLRGKHDACVFPLTGHPPMEVDGWLKYLRMCQSYGLNHIRFHTWTPPEAAFEAADQLGFYLQPELPFWGPFDQHVKDTLEPEAIRILQKYGNHPSFALFSLGNEHWAGVEVLAAFVEDLKNLDSRHLYARGTNAFFYLGRPGKGDQYLISADEKGDEKGPVRSLRGANSGTPDDQSHIQFGPANTMTDYADAIAGSTWPTITHEMGQYTVYPDYKQIAKYTGVAVAHNLEFFRDALQRSGMAEQNDAFAKASGALAAICYREEIESCLRTPNYGGFELLDLQDYPGQGTAPVGILDAFMDSKGIVTPQQWQQFCSPQVLLARFTKYTWTADEKFSAKIQLAQYGENDLKSATLKWSLTDSAGKDEIASGSIAAGGLKRGNVRELGQIVVPLSSVKEPAQLRLNLLIVGTAINTSYPIWVYPPKHEILPTSKVKIVKVFDAAAEAALAAGQNVLLVCDGSKPLANTVGGGFATDFWGFSFFHNKPGTMGLLCDPAAPALKAFPTESHSNWQWFELAFHSQPLVLDSILPTGEKPIVQVIDNYERCHKLGLVFELKVGPGKLLVCATDLLDASATHPEARQLLASLIEYAGSDKFQPRTSAALETLRDLFQTLIPMTNSVATASSFDKGWQNLVPEHLIDGNQAKGWLAEKSDSGEYWCQVTFPKPIDVGGVEIVWADQAEGYAFSLESSDDGTRQTAVANVPIQHVDKTVDRVPLELHGVKSIRVVISKTPDGKPPAVNEIKFFPLKETR